MISPLLLTLLWVTLPFALGFIAYLLPRCDRFLALGGVLVSLLYGAQRLLDPNPISLQLVDNFGVSLWLDELTGWFILTNTLVTLAVICYCWPTSKTAFFYTQILILHGSVNAAFACSDFITLYVALEVLSIATFLLISYPRSDRSLWVGLRYLFVSNVAMLFYLVGAVLVYNTHHSFAFRGLAGAPPEATALILLGLLGKAGIFVLGLWLPLTHSEAESPISALMSGMVIKAGILPLLRCALWIESLDPLVRLLGLGSAVLGLIYAVVEGDTKRRLAWSTISQMGLVLSAPALGGFYACTHGLAKGAIFLLAGRLPSRNLQELQTRPIPNALWWPLAIASASITGFPLVAGFTAKVLTLKNVLPWQSFPLTLVSLGTVIVYAPFIALPRSPAPSETMAQSNTESHTALPATPPQGNLGIALGILVGGLILGNGFYWQTYELANWGKPLLTAIFGLSIYYWGLREVSPHLPRQWEKFQHLMGIMTISLVVLFWMVLV